MVGLIAASLLSTVVFLSFFCEDCEAFCFSLFMFGEEMKNKKRKLYNDPKSLQQDQRGAHVKETTSLMQHGNFQVSCSLRNGSMTRCFAVWHHSVPSRNAFTLIFHSQLQPLLIPTCLGLSETEMDTVIGRLRI